MSGMKAKYWEGRTPPAEYYQTPNPYSHAPECNINLLELTRYAKSIGKKTIDMTYEEVQKFAVSPREA